MPLLLQLYPRQRSVPVQRVRPSLLLPLPLPLLLLLDARQALTIGKARDRVRQQG